MSNQHTLPVRMRSPQAGVVLVIALIMLVAMAMAGIAMVRSMGAGIGIAGNLAFKQNATSVADLGIATARDYVYGRTVEQLALDDAASGYYSSWDSTFNPATYPWTTNSVLVTSNDGTGNLVRYVTHRLCSIANTQVAASAAQNCVVRLDSDRSDKSTKPEGDVTFTDATQVYYRITARVEGVRNAVSYVQVMIY
jgi:type IV pilus assembly protein PilX